MFALSIDPGETMIGYAIANEDTVLTWGHIKRKRCKQRSKTQNFVHDKLNNILNQFKVEKALIEVHTLSSEKFRIDESEIIDAIESLNIPIVYCQANDYLTYFDLIGYDKKLNNFFVERQKEVFKKYKVKTTSRHNVDCLLMAGYYFETENELELV